MNLSHAVMTRLEKAATDNGFDLACPGEGDWLSFASSQTRMRIWLSALGDSLYRVAFSRWDVFEALSEYGIPLQNPLPTGSPAARSVGDVASLHRLIRRAFQLSRSLPDEPLHVFLKQTATLPKTTEAERLVVQRVGQNVFRNGLLDYWEGACAITGLVITELLRASHIKPWADCETDAERLDVFNGLLLAPHLDAAFDGGFITFDDAGMVIESDLLDLKSIGILGFDRSLQLRRINDKHRHFLTWHRKMVFRSIAFQSIK
ncbi:MAG: HNH endonuclease [Magnetococcales bacterium]|nr:HNH endonuclease [Magnetococcales bacterium]